jgi:hypothetical protein
LCIKVTKYPGPTVHVLAWGPKVAKLNAVWIGSGETVTTAKVVVVGNRITGSMACVNGACCGGRRFFFAVVVVIIDLCGEPKAVDLIIKALVSVIQQMATKVKTRNTRSNFIIFASIGDFSKIYLKAQLVVRWLTLSFMDKTQQ